MNPKGRIATPNMDRLADQGMAFTDAHSGSSVCSPTRYGLLTGRYAWRSRLKQGVLGGYSPPLIEPGRLTLPALLKSKGYRAACIGKWHLGLDWPLKTGGRARDDADAWKVDYARPFSGGPTTLGFDEFFGISASLDMPPYVFLDNDRARAVPTVEKTWIRKGPADKDFEAIDVLPSLTERAVEFVARSAGDARRGRPFFLYLPLSAPHTPIVPAGEWKGSSGLNDYADFVVQVDASIGKVMEALDQNGIATDTLVIVTSDNGCSPQADFPALKRRGHDPSGGFRGHKADIFEGGHRIPFLVRWPGKVEPGSTSGRLVGLVDLMATAAEIVGAKLPDNAGEDSVSMLPTLLGRAGGLDREALVHHSANGSFAIRQGRWKLALCADSGGWSPPRPGRDEARGLPPVQLYDLAADPSESRNLQAREPEVVKRLTRLMERYAADGRSTPGVPQPNEGKVDVHKAAKSAP
jgi:arylsulfatase A